MSKYSTSSNSKTTAQLSLDLISFAFDFSANSLLIGSKTQGSKRESHCFLRGYCCYYS